MGDPASQTYLSSPYTVAASALAGRFDDADHAVRNAALRSAGLLQEKHGDAAGALFEVDDVLRAFSRPGVLDRQKAGFLLTELSRRPGLRSKIRKGALDRSLAIARTELSMHSSGGLWLLREIAGEERFDRTEWLDWLRRNLPERRQLWHQLEDRAKRLE